LGTVTQTEQNRESSASSFFYENGETKFRKSKIFCSARWAALLIIQDRLWCGFAQFNLSAHLLDLRGLLFHSRPRTSPVFVAAAYGIFHGLFSMSAS
jgi:hypothetical protein